MQLLDALIGPLALVFLIDVKNMVGVIDAAIQNVQILLKAEVFVLDTVIRRKHAKLKDALRSAFQVVVVRSIVCQLTVLFNAAPKVCLRKKCVTVIGC